MNDGRGSRTRASERARREADSWVEVAHIAAALEGLDLQPMPREDSVTGFDPAADLARRVGRWGHTLDGPGLATLARFGAGLTLAEAEAWERSDRIVATAAFEDRRFLFGDRIVHWAVPWADVASRCHPDLRLDAQLLRDTLLDLGEQLLVAPLLTGDEGLHPPGEDSFGPTGASTELGLLGSGTVLFAATVESLTVRPGDLGTRGPALLRDLATHYGVAASRWSAMARTRPGTARLWRDLARRAAATSHRLDS